MLYSCIVDKQCYISFYGTAKWISYTYTYIHSLKFFSRVVLYRLAVQSLSRVWLCIPMDCSTPGFAVLHCLPHSLKFMSIESVMPSNHFILRNPFSCPQSFPGSGSFPMSQLFASGGQSIWASASVSVQPMNIQGWFPLGLTVSSCSPRDCQHYRVLGRIPSVIQSALIEKKSEGVSCSVVSNCCNPVDCSMSGSSVHEILQARILEWVAISFSRGSSWPRDLTWVSCIVCGSFAVWATVALGSY